MRSFHITISIEKSKCKEPELLDFISAGAILARLPPNSSATSSVSKLYTPFSAKNKKDYRRGRIRIEWVDFKEMNATLSASAGKDKEIRRSKS